MIVALTGATGVAYGVRLLELVRDEQARGSPIETHLVVSKWAARTLALESSRSLDEVQALATHSYSASDLGALISSGSFRTAGMVIAPCSMKTLAAIAHGLGDTLIHRSADVVLKERRRLVLVVREAPLSDIHLENMLTLSRMGAIIFPPVPAFYNRPKTIDDLVTYTTVRVLDQFGIHVEVGRRWTGNMRPEHGD